MEENNKPRTELVLEEQCSDTIWITLRNKEGDQVSFLKSSGSLFKILYENMAIFHSNASSEYPL